MPLWRGAAAALSPLVKLPPSAGAARLWYDTRDIAFLREDAKDAAQILSTRAQTIRNLLDAGFEPDAVVRAIEADDLGMLLGNHSGLFSVQLQPPTTSTPDETGAPSNAPEDPGENAA
jgi:hypothetical protein